MTKNPNPNPEHWQRRRCIVSVEFSYEQKQAIIREAAEADRSLSRFIKRIVLAELGLIKKK